MGLAQRYFVLWIVQSCGIKLRQRFFVVVTFLYPVNCYCDYCRTDLYGPVRREPTREKIAEPLLR